MNEEKKTELSLILSGISTGVSVMAFIGNPLVLWYWLIAVLERSAKFNTSCVVMLICCAVGAVGSLAASIVAKVLSKKLRWPVANIIFISILLVVQGLITWGFMALIIFATSDI